MIFERAILKIFNPVRLARRDRTRLVEALSYDEGAFTRGEHLCHLTYIPPADLRRLLTMMEAAGFVRRYPDPGDPAFGADPLAAWWRPGDRFAELRTLIGAGR